jgi:hypothetical protein
MDFSTIASVPLVFLFLQGKYAYGETVPLYRPSPAVANPGSKETSSTKYDF